VSLPTKARREGVRERPSRRELAGERRTPGFCRSSLLLPVQLLTSQNLQRLRSFEGILLRVVKCAHCFEVLFLNLDVSRQRNRAQTIVTISQVGGLAQFRQRAGPPRFDLGSLCFQRGGALRDAS